MGAEVSPDVIMKSAQLAEEMGVSVTIVKADASLAAEPEDARRISTQFAESDALEPPYDPATLCRVFENSDTLPTNVQAYQTNVESFGHRLDPVVDPKADDAFEEVFNAMWIEGFAQSGGKAFASPTDAEVLARIDLLRDELRIEKFRGNAFFGACCADESFVSLRQRTRQDLEVTGNAYWEVIRDAEHRPAQFVLLGSVTMRLTRRDKKLVDVEEQVKASPLTLEPKVFRRRFRRFVQIITSGERTYFKEYGDPRVVSPETGKFYETVEEMQEAEADPELQDANEVLHFRISFPNTPYGVPRWIGNLLAVLGNRQASEVNFSYFDNKTVPPLVITVSGGRVSQSTRDKLQSFVRDELKGRQNFHKILIIEGVPFDSGGANPPGMDGRMRIDIKPLTDAQNKDALFLGYDERNMDKVGMSFRNPRLLRGDARDFNRATARAVLKFSEQQVYGPLRDEFDWTINRKIMLPLGIKLHKFRSNGPSIRDPEQLSKMIKEMRDADGLTPRDVRDLAGELLFDRDFADIDERWVNRPLEMTLKGMVSNPLAPEPEEGELAIEDEPAEETPPGTEAPPAPEAQEVEEGTEKVAKGSRGRRRRRRKGPSHEALVVGELVRIRDKLLERERDGARRAFEKDRSDDEVETLTMSVEDFSDRFGIVPL